MQMLFGHDREESYWTSEWQSVYVLQGNELAGSVLVETHFCEGGNFA